jgi:hypothetical protein
MLLRIHFGIAEARRENALFLEFQGGSGLVLHWDETGSAEGAVQVDPIINPLQMMYRSQLHGGTAMFRSRSSSEVKPGTGESPIPAGPWRLHCRSDRCIEFHKDGHERPLMHFWFRAKPVTWVLASAEVVAGNAITSLIPADGRTLLKDPVRLARMLESGNG